MHLARRNEFGEFSFRFKFDFQFRDVKVFRVTKLAQQDRIHQLGNALSDLPGVRLFGNLKKDDVGRGLGVNEVKQVVDLRIADLLLEEVSELLSQDRPVLNA